MYRLVHIASEDEEEVEVIPVSWVNENKSLCVYQPTVKSPSTVTHYVRNVVAPKKTSVPYFVAVKKPYDFGATSSSSNVLETSQNWTTSQKKIQVINSEGLPEEMFVSEHVTLAPNCPQVFLQHAVPAHENKPSDGGNTMENPKLRAVCKRKVDDFINWGDVTEEMLRNEDLDVSSPKRTEIFCVRPTVSSHVNKPFLSVESENIQNSSVPEKQSSEYNRQDIAGSALDQLSVSSTSENAIQQDAQNFSCSSSASLSPENIKKHHAEISSTLLLTGHTSNCCPCHKATIKLLQDLELRLQQHTKILNVLLGNNKDVAATQCSFPVQLPVLTIKDLEILEAYLSDAQSFKSAVFYFASFGGENLKKVVKIILEKILTNEVAKEHSMKGRKMKSKFEKYENILNLIFSSTVKHPKCKSATVYEVRTIIQLWLAQASFRGKAKDEVQSSCDSS